MKGIRYANIGFIVATVITVAGVLVFKDRSESAMQAVAMIGFFVGLAVYIVLDERAERREKRRPQ